MINKRPTAEDKAAGRAWLTGGAKPPRKTHDFLLVRCWEATSLTWRKVRTFEPGPVGVTLAVREAQRGAAHEGKRHQVVRMTGRSAEDMTDPAVLFDSQAVGQ